MTSGRVLPSSFTSPLLRQFGVDWVTLGFIVWSIPGWLITALATTFGAPFWFDLLNRMMVIRSTVKPKEKSPDEPAVDRPRNAPMSPPTSLGAVSPPPGPPAPGPPAPAPPAPAPVAAAGGQPAEPLHDGCGVGLGVVTLDEDLPAAQGGVA